MRENNWENWLTFLFEIEIKHVCRTLNQTTQKQLSLLQLQCMKSD